MFGSKIQSNLLGISVVIHLYHTSYCNALYFPRCSSTVNLIYERDRQKGQKPLDDFFETCLFYNWHQAKLERIHCYVHFIYGIRINLCDYKRAQAYHLQPGWCHCYGQELSSLNHPLRIAYPPGLYMNTPFQRETFFETMLLLYCCIHTMWTRTKFVCYPLKSRCHMFVLMFFHTIL